MDTNFLARAASSTRFTLSRTASSERQCAASADDICHSGLCIQNIKRTNKRNECYHASEARSNKTC